MPDKESQSKKPLWKKIIEIPGNLKESLTKDVRHFLLFAFSLVIVFILGYMVIDSLKTELGNNKDLLAYTMMFVTAVAGIICLAFSIDYSAEKKVDIPALLRDIGLELIGASITFLMLSYVFL